MSVPGITFLWGVYVTSSPSKAILPNWALGLLLLVISVMGGGIYFFSQSQKEKSIAEGLKRSDSPLARHQSTLKNLLDQEPYQPPCDFWAPWVKLVDPDSPSQYLSSILALLKDGAQRSETYRQLIMKDPGPMGALRGEGEHICISGYFDAGNHYVMDAREKSACSREPSHFFDQTLELNVKPVQGGGFLNQVHFKLGLGKITADNFRKFWLAQRGLLEKGYRGWSQAYPNFLAVNHAAFGLTEISSQKDEPVTAKLKWLPQSMLQKWPGWATYLLKLGDLAEVESWLEDGLKKRIVSTKLSTRNSMNEITFPSSGAKYFEGDHDVPAAMGQGATVRFRGLEIYVQGLKYQGTLTSNDQVLAFRGLFDGVEQVKIRGSYRNLGALGIGRMISQVVKDTITHEISRLRRDARGQPASLKIGIFPQGDGSYFEVQLSFEAAINMLNIIREDKDQSSGLVMPDPQAIKDLNSWAQETFKGLEVDYSSSRCRASLP